MDKPEKEVLTNVARETTDLMNELNSEPKISDIVYMDMDTVSDEIVSVERMLSNKN